MHASGQAPAAACCEQASLSTWRAGSTGDKGWGECTCRRWWLWEGVAASESGGLDARRDAAPPMPRQE
jgi:hypothetical protein